MNRFQSIRNNQDLDLQGCFDLKKIEEENAKLKARVTELSKELWMVRYEKACAQGADHETAKKWADKLERSKP